MRLHGMIFDVDGTLCNSLPICVAAFQHVFDPQLGRHVTDEEVLAMFGPSEEGMIRSVFPVGWEAALDEFLAEYDRLHQGRVLAFPGIEQALQMLQARGIRLAVVTGKGPDSAEITFRHLGLRSYFDMVEAGSPEGGVKPKGMRRILARWGFPPGKVAYIGDSPSDMSDARSIGVIPLAAGWAATSAVQDPQCCGAEITFGSVKGFCEWIEREVQT